MRVISIVCIVFMAFFSVAVLAAAQSSPVQVSTEVEVRTTDGKPAEHAAVRFLAPGEKGLAVVQTRQTDSVGRSTVMLPQMQEALCVEVEKAGFVTERRLVITGEKVSITLERPAAIEGMVVDEEGSPFGGIELNLMDVSVLRGIEKHSNRVPPMVPYIKVARDGRFRIDNLPSGEYILTLRSDTTKARLAEPMPLIVVTSGQTTSGVLVRVIRHGGIKGRIMFPDGVPNKVRVTPVPEKVDGKHFNEGYVEAMSRSCDKVSEFDCAFELDGLLPGLYRVEVEAKGYGPFLAPVTKNVLPANITDVGDFTAPFPVHLVGKFLDQGKTPVAEAIIAIHFPGIPLAALSAKTDKEGRFGTLLVSPGEYEIIVLHPDFVTREDTVSITGNVKTQELDLTLDPGNRIEGVYVGRDKVPMPGVEILIEKKWESGIFIFKETRTDDAGHFAFRGLVPGTYGVIAMDGLDMPRKEVKVTNGSSLSIVLDAINDALPIHPLRPIKTPLVE